MVVEVVLVVLVMMLPHLDPVQMVVMVEQTLGHMDQQIL